MAATSAQHQLSDIVQTARALRGYGVSRSWLRTEVRQGTIPHLAIGKKVLFDPAAVERELLRRAGQQAAYVAPRMEMEREQAFSTMAPMSGSAAVAQAGEVTHAEGGNGVAATAGNEDNGLPAFATEPAPAPALA